MAILACQTCDKEMTYPGGGNSKTKCASCYVIARRKRHKEQAIEYLGGACQRCGYDRCKAALCFHHRDSTEKDWALNALLTSGSWERIRKELDKCDLLCANCHLEEHWLEEEDIPGVDSHLANRS